MNARSAPTVLLAAVLLGLAFLVGRCLRAGGGEAPTPVEVTHDPGAANAAPTTLTPEEAAHYVEWYNHMRATPSPASPLPAPTPEDVARFREWYNHEHVAPRITSVSPVDATPVDDNAARFLESYRHRIPPVAPLATGEPTPEEIARFVEGYKHEGAPKPSEGPAQSPVPDDAARFLECYRRSGAPTPSPAPAPAEAAPPNPEVERYVEAYQHTGAPTPHAAPVVTTLDVRPVYDQQVRPVAGPELPDAPLSPAPIPVVLEPRPVPVPPPPRAAEAPKETRPTPAAPPAPLPPLAVPPTAAADLEFVSPFDMVLQQAGCSSCGTGGGLLGLHAMADGPGGMADAGPGCNCGGGNCIPGRLHDCSPCEAHTFIGRFLCGLYECICCPDPCYDPHWIPLADAAFFVESARPQTQQWIGWNAGRNFTAPDAGEFSRARADSKGRGPNPTNHANPNGLLGERSVNYNDLFMYTEAALGNIGTFVYVPYRSLDGELVGHAAGFSDVQVGTKTLLFDCELLQLAFEFRTYIPSGDPGKGLGTGHVSLEPSVIVGVKIAPETYFQGQLAEWIPLGGDPDYEGAILHYHMSLNQVLCHILPDVQLIGTAEFNGYSFQHGQFTDPVTGETRITGTTYISMGPGLRLFVCDKIDFGVGMAFAVTDRHFEEELFRSEFRWRY